ncbi:MAG: hypothetical protein NC120_04770 [Ruminococcus sp.]|nr:hypothetical protein [Ruminococcus sp.]
MTMIFSGCKIEIDREKTAEFYRTAPVLSENCQCAYCRNYEKAADILSDAIQDFFKSVGVDIKKPAEVYHNCKTGDNAADYGGFYHLCGRILKGEDIWKRISDPSDKTTVCAMETDLMHKAGDGFLVGFTDNICLLEDNFPRPVIQMEISAVIPWTLDEAQE